MSLADLWFLVQGLFWGTGERPVDAVAAEFAARWAGLFGLADLPDGATEVRLAVADLVDRVAQVFPDRPSDWTSGRLHSPDLQLCAADADALARGDYTVVLGELHAAWPSFDCQVFTPSHPDVARLRAALAADLAGDAPPTTVPGLLVRGLAARAAADAGPVALVSCDNLPANGARLRGLVEQALARSGASDRVLSWVSEQVTFPGTMVDRIVPASTAQTLAAARDALGFADLAAVAAEPYRQWVIEDDFPGGRPAWEAAGAVLTDDAGQWERVKLRGLNGLHSATAYLGALAGRETVADALGVPGLTGMLRRLVAEEVAVSFTPPDGVSMVAYGDEVLARFANPAIRHRTLQIAMDGSQKLPQRVLHTL
ncbi:mannitol dehydrogenase family protein, partial [Micromonospora sp. DH15]|nr:mannitol dehydrogenase family protein [Micromonospora sp. DH15]